MAAGRGRGGIRIIGGEWRGRRLAVADRPGLRPTADRVRETLFNWLRQLLTGLQDTHPGRAVALEITGETFSAEQKKAEALMNYLRKSHGFRFALSRVENIEALKSLTRSMRFDLLKVSPDMMKQLSQEAADDSEEESTLLGSLKNRGARIIVEDVEDATTLTEVISEGADYALGEFIGEASTQLDDLTNVESFEIS